MSYVHLWNNRINRRDWYLHNVGVNYLQVIPMENFNGRKRVEAGDLCERRNGIVFILYDTQDSSYQF